MLIMPPFVHTSFEAFVTAGQPFMNIASLPLTQGIDDVKGVHGIGGEDLLHVTKFGIFIIGLLSMTEAMGFDSASITLGALTERDIGAVPNVHCKMAPLTAARFN